MPDRGNRTTNADAEAPRLYTELAAWWPLLSPPADYVEEAAMYQRILLEASGIPTHTLLELGSGGGNNASHLKARFSLVLVDRSPGMLQVSRALNPECEHVEGDMRTVRLGREFDAVFVHDAVVYMTTEADLRAAIETASVHCKPGGAVLFAPDHVRENFRTSTDHGGYDGVGRGLRYLEWTWDPIPPTARTSLTMRTCCATATDRCASNGTGTSKAFRRAQDWLRLLTDAGFEPGVVPVEHSSSSLASTKSLSDKSGDDISMGRNPDFSVAVELAVGSVEHRRQLPGEHPSVRRAYAQG